MELRRSRRLAGLAPEETARVEKQQYVPYLEGRDAFAQQAGFCTRAFGTLGTVLAFLTLTRAVTAVVCAGISCR